MGTPGRGECPLGPERLCLDPIRAERVGGKGAARRGCIDAEELGCVETEDPCLDLFT